MTPKKYESAEELLKDPTGDIGKLRKMGITDFAIITYVVRVQQGRARDEAIQGLLQGRALTAEQEQFVRSVLSDFRIPA